LTFAEWLQSVPDELKTDPLWRMEAYRLAMFAGELAWRDVSKLAQDGRTRGLSDQLFRAVGSVAANIAEGYSRSSHRDQARFYEYSLGSAREARTWYYQGRPVLSETVVTHRLQLLTQITRLLLATIRGTRGHSAVTRSLNNPHLMSQTRPFNSTIHQYPNHETRNTEPTNGTRNTKKEIQWHVF